MFIHQARKLSTPTHNLLQAMKAFLSPNWQEQEKQNVAEMSRYEGPTSAALILSGLET
jgi:hypothetical protein